VIIPVKLEEIRENLRLYNTLTKDLEKFKPIEDNKVRIYSCGLTVNDYMHIGHARTYTVWDVLVRYLRFLGYEVFHVSNITDISIDEKILKRLEEEKISYQQLIEKYTKAYFEDRAALGIERANVHPLATQHIQEMIELIEKLIAKGFAYVAEDGVYFSIQKFKDYGKLSGIKKEALLVGASGRIAKDEYDKEYIGDFALWKATKPNEPYWYSPWGKGRPGWHIECSAMSMKYLGESFDIHTGGEDNIFPHHENELAQSEAATGKPFVRYWLHTRHVLLGGEKMSKSYKRLIYLRDAIKKYGATNLRLYLLSTHYRKQLLFDEKGIEEAKLIVERVSKAVQFLIKSRKMNIKEEKSINLLKTIEENFIKFLEAMNDDLNTPLAIKHLDEMARIIITYVENNGYLDSTIAEKLLNMIDPIGEIIFGDLYKKEMRVELNEDFEKFIEELIKKREELRKQANYSEADKIREKLRKLGIEVEDAKVGTLWFVKQLSLMRE
jgi:cysteinyl-tRNA synthetase